MAHQAHNIPWNTLASTIKVTSANRCQHEAENFHARRQEDRGKKWNYFANAFVRNAMDHSRCEREKYAKELVAPGEEDVVLSDEVCNKINATVHRWRRYRLLSHELGPVKEQFKKGLCTHTGKDEECECPLPFRERKMSSFLRTYFSNPCYMFFDTNAEAFFNLEVIKTLILYGEMETILWVCAHPGVDLKRWWDVALCQCEKRDVGWDRICRVAMDVYILLNVIHCFPETWDEAGRPVQSYTSLKAYQYLVRRCTKSGWASEICTYPHRQFFGIDGEQFRTMPEPADKELWAHIMVGRYSNMAYYPYGLMPYEDFLSFEKPATYLPHSLDVSHVRWILCEKGLPVELSNSILEKASYTPKRRLPVSGDPLHPDNRAELKQHLTYCWQLIIRCTMMGQTLGMDMDRLLGNMVRESMEGLFGCKCFKFTKWLDEEGGYRLVCN